VFGDGIHPYGGYKKLYQSAVGEKVLQAAQEADGSEPNPNIDDATRDRARAWAAKQNTPDAVSSESLQVPSSIWHGKDTEAIQQALIDLGYKLPKHGADSFFGPETAQAVRQFQKDNGLKVDGDPGPETIGKLNSLAKKKPDAPAVAADTPAPVGPARNKADATVKKPEQGAMIAPRTDKPANTTGGKNIVDKGDVSAYLKSKKMSGNHRIGILANIQGESGFNSAVINPNDKGKRSIGFFQHRDDRDRNLEAAVPDWRTNWQGQIDFALSEPAGRRYLSTRFKTYEEAVEQWVRDFERPADTWGATVKRIAIADQLVKNKV
jgi:peptidoglycan hydrolase-like protein with peptidoglycan-binding domain